MMRQEPRLARAPATVRASSMPTNRPLITVPTARPRCSGAARVAANGTSTWTTTENSPVNAVPTSTRSMDGAEAVTSRPAAESRESPTASPRRSMRSPRGTISSSPSP